VNHACQASLGVLFEDMDLSFVIPGMPWVSCVRSATAIAVRDIGEGEELTLNYELFPPYMMRKVDGVASCLSNDVSI